MAVPVRRTFAAPCTGGVVNEARWSYPPERGDNDGDEDDIPNPIFQDGSRSNCGGKKGKGEAEGRETGGWSSSPGRLAGLPLISLGRGPTTIS